MMVIAGGRTSEVPGIGVISATGTRLCPGLVRASRNSYLSCPIYNTRAADSLLEIMSLMNLAGFLLLSVLTANTGTAPESLVDAYFDEYFSFAPSEGTSAGFHQYDSRLENYSDSAIRARLAMQRKYLAAFQSLPRSDDRDLMVSRIQAAILNLDSLR